MLDALQKENVSQDCARRETYSIGCRIKHAAAVIVNMILKLNEERNMLHGL